MGLLDTVGQIATGGAMGIITGQLTRGQQLADQKKLMREQAIINKEQAIFNQGLGKEMWDYTNYENQMKHIINAGLNPALMYGSAGASGTTSGAGTAGDVTSAGAATDTERANSILSMALTTAQIDNIKADTKKKEADANYTSGAQTNVANQNITESQARINEIGASIGNKEADTKLKNLQGIYQEIQNKIAEDTKEDRTNEIKWLAQKTLQDFKIAFNEAYVAEKTQQIKIKSATAQLIGQYIANQAGLAGIAKTKAEITKINTDMAQEWVKIGQNATKLSQGQKQNEIAEFEALLKANYPNMWNVVGKNIDRIMEIRSILNGDNPVENYQKGMK